MTGDDLDGRTVCTLDLLGSTGHTLLIVAADVAQARKAVTRAGPSEVDVKTLVLDGRTDRRHRRLRGRLVLVPPDGYVACIAPLDRPDVAERYMHNLIREQGAVRNDRLP